MARKTEKVVLLDQLAAIAAGFEKASLLASRFAADYERLIQERVVCGRGRDPTLSVSRRPWSRRVASGILRSG